MFRIIFAIVLQHLQLSIVPNLKKCTVFCYDCNILFYKSLKEALDVCDLCYLTADINPKLFHLNKKHSVISSLGTLYLVRRLCCVFNQFLHFVGLYINLLRIWKFQMTSLYQIHCSFVGPNNKLPALNVGSISFNQILSHHLYNMYKVHSLRYNH